MTDDLIIDQAKLLEKVDQKPGAIDRLKWLMLELVQVADCRARAATGVRAIDRTNEQKARIEEQLLELFAKLQVKEFDQRILKLQEVISWYVDVHINGAKK